LSLSKIIYSYLFVNFVLFWAKYFITPYEALVYMMLDAGYSLLDTGFRLKTSIEHQASKIEYLAFYGSLILQEKGFFIISL